ncbi:MAG: serine/threonine-protein kinase, partial [Myxococcota bacterium]
MSDAAELTSSRGSRYRFLSRIATGGMAELYLGEASGIGGVSKRVALKRILPGHAQDKEYLEMFLEEARLASTLQHPNIVQTYDVIKSGDDYVIVMEFLEGSDLYQFRRRLRTTGHALQLQHVLYIILGVLSGLHYAHERRRNDGRLLGIVHRDVSPQNVYLTYDGGVKLLDFGIAKAETGAHRTESGVLKGKVLYMSPEQCAGKAMDRRADVYAVGVVMYQLLTGALPHRGKNAYDTMKAIIDDPVPRPSSINPRINPALERILMSALAKEPDGRFATARDLQVELEQFANDHGQFVSSVGFSTFVETTLGPRRAPSDASTLVVGPRHLPIDIEVPAGEAQSASVDASASLEQVLFESPQAVLKRIAGIQVLALSGVIDEGFDASRLGGQLKGEVIVDSGDVTRITSFGIRQLIQLFTEAKPRVTGLYHVRCSVAMVSQVTMIRSLLGGGRILSFHVPYLDSSTGTAFNVVMQGQEASRAITGREIPHVPSPSDPSRPGEFDDDPEVYFNFAEDFLAEAPPHLGPALRALEERERRLELELTVAEDGSTLFIRRPLREADRWKRVLQGLEGAVKLDLSEVTSTDEIGVRAFVRALEGVSEDVRSLRIVGAPLAVCGAIAVNPALRALTSFDTVQVFGRCRSCNTERRLMLSPTDALTTGAQPIPRGCSRCGGALVITSDLAPLGPWGRVTAGAGTTGAGTTSAGT